MKFPTDTESEYRGQGVNVVVKSNEMTLKPWNWSVEELWRRLKKPSDSVRRWVLWEARETKIPIGAWAVKATFKDFR